MRIVAIIPTLNKRKEMLAEAVESVKNQTVQCELIVVSEPKDTWEKINKVVSETDCDAFFVLSDDDLVDSRFVEVTSSVMESTGCDIVATFLENFGDETGIHGPERLPFMTTLTRKSIWEKVGGYDPSIGISADSDFWEMCLKSGARLERVSEPLFKYRKHGGQWSNNGDWESANKNQIKKHGVIPQR